MIIAILETREMKGDTSKSGMVCLGCSHRMTFPGPGDTSVVVYSYVNDDRKRLVVLDAERGSRLHDCLVERLWYCELCDEVQEQVQVRRNRVAAVRCSSCAGRLIQIEKPQELDPARNVAGLKAFWQARANNLPAVTAARGGVRYVGARP